MRVQICVRKIQHHDITTRCNDHGHFEMPRTQAQHDLLHRPCENRSHRAHVFSRVLPCECLWPLNTDNDAHAINAHVDDVNHIRRPIIWTFRNQFDRVLLGNWTKCNSRWSPAAWPATIVRVFKGRVLSPPNRNPAHGVQDASMIVSHQSRTCRNRRRLMRFWNRYRSMLSIDTAYSASTYVHWFHFLTIT